MKLVYKISIYILVFINLSTLSILKYYFLGSQNVLMLLIIFDNILTSY